MRDLSEANGRRILTGLRLLPEQISQVLAEEEAIAEVASRYADAQHMFFVGRVRGWPVAREGAQKLKEISYVHAEAYQSSDPNPQVDRQHAAAGSRDHGSLLG